MVQKEEKTDHYDFDPGSESEGEDLKLKEYTRKKRESEGFDVATPFSRRMQKMEGGIHDLCLEIDYCKELAMNSTKIAIDEYNRLLKDSYGELEFVELLKAMEELVAGFMYYLTFKAKNLTEDQVFVYQAVTWSLHEERVLSFRLKPGEGPKPDWPKWFFRHHRGPKIEAVPILKDKNDVEVDKSHPRSEEAESHTQDLKRRKVSPKI